MAMGLLDRLGFSIVAAVVDASSIAADRRFMARVSPRETTCD